MKRKINVAKVTWVSALFLGLVVILIMVMDYKIHYQYQTNNKIYFYECDGTLCVMEVKDDDHLMYSYYDCSYEECPIFKSELDDTYVVLTEDNTNILFNYRSGKEISSDYDNYQILNSNYFIVTKGTYQGIINSDNEIIVSLSYDQLGYVKDNFLIGYSSNFIIAKKNNKYGIISIKNGSVLEPIEHEENEIEDLLKLLLNEELLL